MAERLFEIAARLSAMPDLELRADVLLASMTGLRVGGPAALVAIPHTPEAVLALLAVDAEHLVLGSGSRVVAGDAPFPGLVIDLGPAFSAVRERDGGLRVGAAAPMSRILRRAVARGLVCELRGRGTLGGALACGEDVGSSVVRALVARRGSVGWESAGAFAPDVIVLEVELRLAPGDTAATLQALTTLGAAAASTGPLFTDPDAALLITAHGAAAFTYGGACLSADDPNRVVNSGGATALDVARLIERVRQHVAACAQKTLTVAARFVGAAAMERAA